MSTSTRWWLVRDPTNDREGVEQILHGVGDEHALLQAMRHIGPVAWTRVKLYDETDEKLAVADARRRVTEAREPDEHNEFVIWWDMSKGRRSASRALKRAARSPSSWLKEFNSAMLLAFDAGWVARRHPRANKGEAK